MTIRRRELKMKQKVKDKSEKAEKTETSPSLPTELIMVLKTMKNHFEYKARKFQGFIDLYF